MLRFLWRKSEKRPVQAVTPLNEDNCAVNPSSSDELEYFIDNLSHLINAENVFKGCNQNRQFVHIIFTNEDPNKNCIAANKTAKMLVEKGLIQVAPTEKEAKKPNVQMAKEPHQHYPQGTYFIRVHQSSYTEIVKYMKDNYQITLPSYDNVQEYMPKPRYTRKK